MMVVDSACLTGGLLYSMSLSSASMRCRVSSETPERPLMTLETVDGVVFASFGDVRQLRSLTGGTHIGLR